MVKNIYMHYTYVLHSTVAHTRVLTAALVYVEHKK